MNPESIIAIMPYVGIIGTLTTGLVLYIKWPSRRTIAALGAELKQGGIFKD